MAFADMKDKSIPQPDIVAAQDAKYVKTFQNYDVSNPHPGFGKDPNILNEFGHTKYPKWVTKPDGEKVIVQSEEEEIALTKNDNNKAELNQNASELKQDGPTVEQYVAAGYDPSTYPPKGYASKSTPEEIKVFVDKHKKTGW
jgi:hypothetical protein